MNASTDSGESLALRIFRGLLVFNMCTIGVMHFVAPETFMAIMPDYLPWHRELVLVSGVFEILGGVGVAIPRTRKAAGWGLIALMICVFPANLWQATQGIDLPGLAGPAWARWARLPMQLVFIYWAYAVTQPRSARAEG